MVEDREKSIKKFLVLIIISLLIVGYYFYWIFINTVAAFARGPQFVFFGLFMMLVFLFVGLFSFTKLVSLKYGPEKKKTFVKTICLIFIIVFAGLFVNSAIERRTYHMIVVSGIERQYLMTMPSNYSDSNAPIPLLIACHGGSGNAKQFKSSMDFDRLAELYNFIVVYPDGMPVNNIFKNMKVWNSGYIKSSVEMGINDVEFLTLLIQTLLEKYSIDPARVYMTGHSNGAMMTYRMGGERADLFAAIAPTAGSIGGNMTPDSPRYIIPTPSRPSSVIHVHGYLDKNVPYNGGVPESGYNVGVRYDLSVNDSVGFWIENNGCNPVPIEESSKNNKISVKRWTGGANGTEVVLVTLWEVNHFTQNMDKAIEEEELYGMKNLSELIWLLLSKYTKI